MEREFLGGKVIVKIGDITEEKTEAIVNAANSTLLGGGGVDGAIHNKGGKEISEECKKIRRDQYPQGLPTGEAVVTTAGKLPSKFIIHTVGPIYGQNEGRDGELLANSYTNSLKIAQENNLETVAFPSISTGAFHYPKQEAAEISSTAIREFLEQNSSIKKIYLVFFSPKDAEIFVKYQQF